VIQETGVAALTKKIAPGTSRLSRSKRACAEIQKGTRGNEVSSRLRISASHRKQVWTAHDDVNDGQTSKLRTVNKEMYDNDEQVKYDDVNASKIMTKQWMVLVSIELDVKEAVTDMNSGCKE
jgi:hypothetical protein